jgi:tetratricopeptide (TPR) repeat protein
VYTKQQRVLVVVIAVAIAALLFRIQANVAAWMAIGFACLVMYGYFRYRPVYLLTVEICRGNFARARALLPEIGDPSELSREEQAYYYLGTGWMALDNQAYEDAQTKIEQALILGLRTANDIALAHLLLARVFTDQGRNDTARVYLSEAKNYQHKKEVAVEIAQLEATLDHARGTFKQPI